MKAICIKDDLTIGLKVGDIKNIIKDFRGNDVAELNESFTTRVDGLYFREYFRLEESK